MKKFNDKRRADAGFKQEDFDWLDAIPDIPNKRSARPWYYITRHLNAEMLLEFDANGQPVWVEHDMRRGVYPHMFSCMSRAQQASVRLNGSVRSCFYNRLVRKWEPIEQTKRVGGSK